MWPIPQETADLVTFTQEIFEEELHILCSVSIKYDQKAKYSPEISVIFSAVSIT